VEYELDHIIVELMLIMLSMHLMQIFEQFPTNYVVKERNERERNEGEMGKKKIEDRTERKK
jgi:hypothetical protein